MYALYIAIYFHALKYFPAPQSAIGIQRKVEPDQDCDEGCCAIPQMLHSSIDSKFSSCHGDTGFKKLKELILIA